MQFRQYKDPLSGEVDPSSVEMVDDDGKVWIVPLSSRGFFYEQYQDWLSQEGNVLLPAAS